MNEPGEPRGRRVDEVELHYGVATDVGLVREVNEDSLLADPPVFVVADGMGGHDGGDIASRIVVEEFARLAEIGYDARRGSDAVMATLRASQRRLSEYGATHRGSDGGRWHGGTTAVVAILVEEDDGPGGCWPTSATPASTASTAASCTGSAPTTASCRSWSTPAGSPRSRPWCIPSGTSSPARSAVPTRSTRTSSCVAAGRGRAASCCAPTA